LLRLTEVLLPDHEISIAPPHPAISMTSAAAKQHPGITFMAGSGANIDRRARLRMQNNDGSVASRYGAVN
jgi:hypothetical protein